MSQNEKKRCPRCNEVFECKAVSIEHCACTTIVLDENERNYMMEQFEDCLCVTCMIEVKEALNKTI